MGKVKGKHRLDKYYRLAKEQGYRSRASWKLAQLDTKFSFLRSAHGVLDLCAAPGGWMQVAVQRVPVGSLVLGIDLVPVAPIRGAVAIEQDITKPECRSKIKQVMERNGVRAFDLVLHDGSPNVGGAWDQEAMSQNALVIDSVKLATEFLSPKGTFVTKVFRSRDYNSVLFCLKQLFEKVEVFKPPASRSASAETYLLGLKYKAPAKIDPRLLDVRHLFQGAVEPRKVVDVLRVNKQKRHRDGYEEGESIVRKVASAADFIWSENPLEILGSVTTISFDDQASLPIKDHDLTTEEIKILCDDLPVLGKNDFKYLLKWRMQLRKSLSPSRKESSKKDPDAGKEDENGGDDKLLNELEELTNATDRKKKREKKLLAKRRAKDKLRKATGAQVDVLEDGYTDHELFSLSSIKGKKDLVAVDNHEDGDGDGNGNDSDNGEHGDGASGDSDSDIDSDEERQSYSQQMEEIFDEAYDRYMSKKEGSAKQRKRARQAYAEKLEEDGDGDEEIQSDYDSDKNEGNDEANPLVVPLDDGEAATQEEIANKWFSQDIFAEAVEEGDLGQDDSQDQMQIEKPNKNQSKADKSKETKLKSSTGSDQTQPKSTKNEDDFEIVPTPATDSSSDSSSDESDEEDINAKAEILAYAKKMLRKKQREQMLDDAYNKYMFDDEGLPKWFVDDEKRHRQQIKPITKEEVAAMRAQFKEINARPAKKVAEAKARKKRAAMRRLEKVRKKANSISDQADISDRSKGKMIEQLYKKAEPKKPKKEYVVAKKGVGVKVGKGQVRVDRRMKKDTRARGTGKPGKKGKKVSGDKRQKGKVSAGKKGKRAM
ncbi:PREDICTED: putative rRNA methyltransferase isoform X1 [Tarenaya hassleriana]|uniref:putative rRNA methyltransferase isoform X1 n=1 Tax=Tarenaya hassleriana TaxID=28532 RepID=UPI00053C23BB|nr:PREDICTED: putative rRNA methyltransferase isoform X1 [Tarenaya hassleriana]